MHEDFNFGSDLLTTEYVENVSSEEIDVNHATSTSSPRGMDRQNRTKFLMKFSNVENPNLDRWIRTSHSLERHPPFEGRDGN